MRRSGGYGASGTPPSTPDHAPYAKRAMALDMVRVMESLGFARFAVAGHDRGARVAYRLALDHPQCVARLAVLDIIPTAEALRRADARLALAFWPWSLLAQPSPLPERLIASDPEAVIEDAASQWGTDAASMPYKVRAAYADALRDPARVHAIREEYRAAATLDVAHDTANLDMGRRIICPTLVLWAAHSALDHWYVDAGGPLGIWRTWARRSAAWPPLTPPARPCRTSAFYDGRSRSRKVLNDACARARAAATNRRHNYAGSGWQKTSCEVPLRKHARPNKPG